jgi:hypothetical protein
VVLHLGVQFFGAECVESGVAVVARALVDARRLDGQPRLCQQTAAFLADAQLRRQGLARGDEAVSSLDVPMTRPLATGAPRPRLAAVRLSAASGSTTRADEDRPEAGLLDAARLGIA